MKSRYEQKIKRAEAAIELYDNKKSELDFEIEQQQKQIEFYKKKLEKEAEPTNKED